MLLFNRQDAMGVSAVFEDSPFGKPDPFEGTEARGKGLKSAC
jgi:hypothetical protein